MANTMEEWAVSMAVDMVMPAALVPFDSLAVAIHVAVRGMDVTADPSTVTEDTWPLASAEYYLLLSPFLVRGCDCSTASFKHPVVLSLHDE